MNKVPRQMLVAIIAAIFVAVVFFMFFLKPKMAEIADTKDKVAAAKADEADLQSQIQKLQDIRQQEPELRARLNAVAGALPSEPDLPDFIRQVQASATQAGVDLQSIAPSPPTKIANATGVQQVNVTIVVASDFYPLEDFLARIENMRRVVEVGSISVSPQTDAVTGETTLQSTLSLKMYVVQPTAQIGAAPVPTETPSAGASP
ncbi:MAG: type 4a pilus biogenesis protein PilO [Actinomycetota bacterium]|nr:type 4a pilus biogenesis protein PilO [Actinomycetota bacterium]